jgi:hypothetical protein
LEQEEQEDLALLQSKEVYQDQVLYFQQSLQQVVAVVVQDQLMDQ